MFRAAAMRRGAFRALDAAALLTVVQQDSGETAKYYAVRYFGAATEKRVQHLLWSDLKKHGHVDMTRSETQADEPRWFIPSHVSRRAPRVSRYRAEDYDLSVLKECQRLGVEQEREVVEQLQGRAPVLPSAGRGWRHDVSSLLDEAEQ